LGIINNTVIILSVGPHLLNNLLKKFVKA